MAKKNFELQKQTRENFINAFWILYEKKSINKISIEELTDLAGYHRNSFYRYFTSIYDLLEQVEDELAEKMIEYTDERVLGNEKDYVKKVFESILESNDRRFTLLFKKDEESNFSARLKEKLFPIERKNFEFNKDEILNDYIVDCLLSGAVAIIARYFKYKDIPAKEVVNMGFAFTKLFADLQEK